MPSWPASHADHPLEPRRLRGVDHWHARVGVALVALAWTGIDPGVIGLVRSSHGHVVMTAPLKEQSCREGRTHCSFWAIATARRVCWAADSEQAQSRRAWARAVPRDRCDLGHAVVAWPGVAVISSLPAHALLPIVRTGSELMDVPSLCSSWRSGSRPSGSRDHRELCDRHNSGSTSVVTPATCEPAPVSPPASCEQLRPAGAATLPIRTLQGRAIRGRRDTRRNKSGVRGATAGSRPAGPVGPLVACGVDEQKPDRICRTGDDAVNSKPSGGLPFLDRVATPRQDLARRAHRGGAEGPRCGAVRRCDSSLASPSSRPSAGCEFLTEREPRLAFPVRRVSGGTRPFWLWRAAPRPPAAPCHRV